ncbi:uncharacterized protein LOC100821387 [Anopheles sinensis]|uniref:Uncharacterized protein LOC100821387 n=1 Tax=Anopheles sinensis TaxID=74873 RepID=A0A084WIR4_ANOSI|nr:uncharacterized protein LOC100821387 [Anopheles sinensis]
MNGPVAAEANPPPGGTSWGWQPFEVLEVRAATQWGRSFAQSPANVDIKGNGDLIELGSVFL